MSKAIHFSITTAWALLATANVVHADLIAYWPFDEGEGDVAGDVVGGYDGVITGGGSWLTPGREGASAFEGFSREKIDCGAGPSPATEDLTLAWWMIDNQTSWGTIMDKSVTGSGYGYNILVRPSNEDSPLRFRIGGWQSYGGWGQECRVPPGAYNDGEWVHIVCTYDSATDTASIYVNGELPENGAFNPKTGIAGPGGYCEGVNNVDTPLSIRGGEESFNGVLDEIAIWDHALTAEEVMTVYALGPLGLATSPPSITEIAYSPGDDTVALTWNSRERKLYDLLSATDLSAPPAGWEVFAGAVDLPASGTGTNTLAGVPASGPRRFFVVREKDVPPPLWADFEGGAGGWTVETNGIVSNTTWEVGPPLAGPPGAHGGANVFGTDLDADFEDGVLNGSLGVALRSPVVDLSGSARATLSFWYFLEVRDDLSGGRLNILRGDDRSPLEGFSPALFDASSNTADWTEFTLRLPQEALDAGSIILEWEFLGAPDGIPDNNGAGWFIDDVWVGR